MDDVIVVGVDGSAPARHAARWAGDLAAAEGCGVRLVHGYLHPMSYAVPFGPYPMVEPEAGRAAAALVASAAADLRAAHPDLVVEERVEPSAGGPALVDASAGARLLVVGRRGVGGFAHLLLGSVSSGVAVRAHCSVAVVHEGDAPADPAAPVVVGVDGSAGGAAAARWAARAAHRRGARLELVHAWWASPYVGLTLSDDEAQRAARARADAVLADTLAAVAAELPELAVGVRPVHTLNAAEALIDAGSSAALLVVGPRGHSALTGLLVGSVTQSVLQHAAVPVVVARADPAPPAEPAP
ncbi:universal stress protein [Pilimelia anulata]|uniref:Universal stress protein n=1 Tax=Pilimelia anulata TaxID=53371 RepID=A0A8J3FD25_9ACTN|nr:universal stress protein [Pilimelia anulata]GGK07978.1 universal stress protein [Pilimelia anulata]